MQVRRMKNATLPALRVDPSLREELESLLEEGETLSGFMEEAVRTGIEQRRNRQAFIARGLASRERAREADDYHAAESVLRELDDILDSTK